MRALSFEPRAQEPTHSGIYNFEYRKLEIEVPAWPRTRKKVPRAGFIRRVIAKLRTRQGSGKLQQMRLKGM